MKEFMSGLILVSIIWSATALLVWSDDTITPVIMIFAAILGAAYRGITDR